MLTARGWWLLFWTGFLTFWGVVLFAYFAPTVPILGFTLLFAMVVEWVIFGARCRVLEKGLNIQRQLLIGERESPTMWAGVPCEVRLIIHWDGRYRLPYAAFGDKLPEGQSVIDGETRLTTGIFPGQTLELSYRLKPMAPGVVRFEGVEVRIADLCGLFYHRIFLRLPTDYLILPPLTDDEGHQRATKRFNTLPPPGEHRLRRPGGGSELLDLRDYRAGDPPKTIAWKASARRDRLITKEFENDVPLRCTLFVDASNSTRLGTAGETALCRMVSVAAAVGQAASAKRDLVGLCVFDEQRFQSLKPARTRIHLMQMLRMLAEAAGRPVEVPDADFNIVTRTAHSLAQEQYPDLLNKDYNSRPFGLYWLPLLDSNKGWWLILPIGIQMLMTNLTGLNTLIGLARDIVKPRGGLIGLIPLLMVFGLLYFLPTILMGMCWFIYGIRGWFSPRSGRMTKRKQLAAIFVTLDDDPVAAIETYINDDQIFVARCNRFLTEHHLSPPPVLYDADGVYRYRGVTRVDVLAQALVRSIGYARDNEQFVILADLVELSDELEPLLRAVRAARARHHQILVLLCWPHDVPEPIKLTTRKLKDNERPKISLGAVVATALRNEYMTRFEQVRTALVRVGASVVRVNEEEPVALVLERMEQLRMARIRR